MRSRLGKLVLLPLVLAGVVLVVFKAGRTPEWTVLTGDVEARQDICRSVWLKARWRAAWSLARLLSDPAPDVRVPAIAALARRPDLHARFLPTVEGLARSGSARVRARALEYLLQHPETLSAAWLSQAASELREPQFRDQHPQLFASYLAAELGRGNADAVAWALTLLERHSVADCRVLEPLLRYPALLRPFRGRFIGCLEGAGEGCASLLVAALTAIDGRLRGTSAADWREPALDAGEAVSVEPAPDRFTIEAEWANRVHPNFQIDTHEDAVCLHLGEGAGGQHFWRKHDHSSVDVGKAQFTFSVGRDARYQVWCRCWFLDKCGNHSLLHVDERWLRWQAAGHDDSHDVLRAWHWKRLETDVALTSGRHTLTVTAGDDGLRYDKFSVLPVGERFDPQAPPPLNAFYDPSVPPGMSMTAERQAQSRGTAQTVTAWVRRNSDRLVAGQVAFSLPAPFTLLSPAVADVRFAPGSAVVRADFRVSVPNGASAGEQEAKAVFSSAGERIASSSIILGVNYDWYTTGPLQPSDPRCVRLKQQLRVLPADLAKGWQRYPEAGYDRYRRLDFEGAFGQAQNACIFLYTEIEVGRAGDYTSFLTLDDCGYVFVDGRRVAGRDVCGVGEGWLLVDPIRLSVGRHTVFAWVYQSDFADPSGADAGRHTPNHWNFKWLLRESRHHPAVAVRGVPVTAATP